MLSSWPCLYLLHSGSDHTCVSLGLGQHQGPEPAHGSPPGWKAGVGPDRGCSITVPSWHLCQLAPGKRSACVLLHPSHSGVRLSPPGSILCPEPLGRAAGASSGERVGCGGHLWGGECPGYLNETVDSRTSWGRGPVEVWAETWVGRLGEHLPPGGRAFLAQGHQVPVRFLLSWPFCPVLRRCCFSWALPLPTACPRNQLSRPLAYAHTQLPVSTCTFHSSVPCLLPPLTPARITVLTTVPTPHSTQLRLSRKFPFL